MDNDAESQQSGENKSVPKTDDDEQQLVAGRKPAGKLVIFHKNCTQSVRFCNRFIESKSISVRHCETVRNGVGIVVCVNCHVFFPLGFFPRISPLSA